MPAASAADAMPIPLAQVEAEIFAEAAGWPLASADVPIVQRLAAAAVAKEDKMYQMKKAHQQEMYALNTEHYRERLEAWEEGATQGVQDTEAVMKHRLKELEHKHAEVLANIERARKEDMEAVESRHQRELTEEAARHKREMAERDKRYVDAQNPEEKLQTQLAMLQKKYNALLKLVGPTQKLMTSNPDTRRGALHFVTQAPTHDPPPAGEGGGYGEAREIPEGPGTPSLPLRRGGGESPCGGIHLASSWPGGGGALHRGPLYGSDRGTIPGDGKGRGRGAYYSRSTHGLRDCGLY